LVHTLLMKRVSTDTFLKKKGSIIIYGKMKRPSHSLLLYFPLDRVVDQFLLELYSELQHE
jgi:hypothetical protein